MRCITIFRTLLTILVLCHIAPAEAQLYCPPNINFELGSLTNWNFFTAQNNGSGTLANITSTTPVTNRHVLTSGTATDYYGGFPIVDPIGGSYSLKLGNDNIGAEAEIARYYVTVPATVNNYSLIYRYAVVLENPFHAAANQPYFKVRVYNAVTNVTINCASFTYVSQSSLPGFSTSSKRGNHTGGAVVYYKPWATASLNLTGQAGNTLVVEFTTADCSLAGHMGYGYVDVSCGLFAISSSTCNATSPLSAPPGFQKYTWYNANYSAVIDSGQSITVATPASLTQYHVVLTPYPGYGCADTLTTQILGTSLNVQAGPDTMLCNNSSVQLTPTVSGNAAPYSYSWAPASGLSCSNCRAPLASPTVHTNYVLSVTDSLGCIRRDTVQVKAAVALNTQVTNALCYGIPTGSATAAASQGTGPFSYSWNTSPPQTSSNAVALHPGSYSVTATDLKGCSATRQITIGSPAQLIAGIGSTDSVSCPGGSDGRATLTVSGGRSPYTYRWNTSPVQTTATATGLAAGINLATVTDSNGCIDTVLANVPAPAPIIMSIAKTAVLCKGGSTGTATISATGGSAPYSFAADSGSFGSSNLLTGLNAGAHIIHLKDAKGCIKDTLISIAEPGQLQAAYTATQPACFGSGNGSLSLTASGGTAPFQYAMGSGGFSSNATFGSLSAGTYVLHVRDSNGCLADSMIVLAQPAPLAVSVTVTPALCYGDSTGSLTMIASGGTPAYLYALGTGTFGTNAIFSGLPAATHILHLKDANGCTKDTSVTVGQVPPLSLSHTATMPLCNGASNGTIILAGGGGSGPYQYALNSGAFGTGSSFNSLAAGTYILRVRDANNCRTDSTMLLAQPPALVIGMTNTRVSCYGGSNGTAAAVASGGTAPYTYAWSGLTQITPAVTGLSAGSYTLTLTDNKGCSSAATVIITQPTALNVTFTTTSPICSGSATGSASAAVSGGTTPYSYSWSTSPPRTTPTAGQLASGSYTLTVTDSAGCIWTGSATVPQTLPVTVSIVPDSVSCFGGKDGTATASASNGTAPFTYAWSTNPIQAGATVTSLPAGTYTVTATSAAGCSGTAQVTISQPAALKATAVALGTCPGFKQGKVSTIITGGTAPYSYLWHTTPVQTTASIGGLDTGVVLLKVTDSKGCRDSTTATIILYSNPVVKAEPGQEICLGSTAVLGVSGASRYTWSPGAGLSCTDCPAPVASPAAYTVYTVVGTDEHNCQDTDTVAIRVVQRVPVSVAARVTICEGDSAQLGASGGIAWQWSPAGSIGNGDSKEPWVWPRVTTVYRVIITENHCFEDTLEQEVEVLPTPTVDLGPDLEALMGAELRLSAAVTGANRISWTPAEGLSCSDCFTPLHKVRGKATYIAEVQNSLGCPATDTIHIRDICDEHYFYFANVFTPNGDGQNDRFYPQGIGNSVVARFMIYDRWGEIVFSASNIHINDPNAGWDGTFRNQALKPDVYVYVMDAVCETGRKLVIRGDISLIR